MTRLTSVAALLALALGGCLLKPDRCGENQREFDDLFAGCVCEEGTVPNDDGIGCRPCGDNQVVQNEACVCEAGFARDDEGSCQPAADGGSGGDGPTGQDMPCESSADCEGLDADYCETLQGKVCLVQGCASGESTCSEGRVCCDFSAVPLGGLDQTDGLCIPEGTCESPGVRVEP